MIETRVLTGDALETAQDDLARLRIEVFRDWPYLYDGDVEYERKYLSGYTHPTAIVVAAFDGTRIVGASTGMGLEVSDEDFATAFADRPEALSDIFYCAESVLLSDYRGHGLGHAFFDAREAYARELGRRYSAFCGVVRPEDHPMRPAAARSLEPFWRGRGYAPLPGVIAHFNWRDVGEADETAHPLQFWMRTL